MNNSNVDSFAPHAGLALWVWCIFTLKVDVGEEELSPLATPLPFKVECLVWPFQKTWPYSGMVLSILVLPLLASHLLFLQSFISEEHHTEKSRLSSTKADPANRLHGFFSVLFWMKSFWPLLIRSSIAVGHLRHNEKGMRTAIKGVSL